MLHVGKYLILSIEYALAIASSIEVIALLTGFAAPANIYTFGLVLGGAVICTIISILQTPHYRHYVRRPL